MSKLVYNHATQTLLLFNRDGNKLGMWRAGNNVDSKVGLKRLPAGSYEFKYPAHVRHGARDGDTVSGKFGPMGIFLLRDFNYLGVPHTGVGVHSGRKHVPDGLKRTGPRHATHLCIRTTDAAMSMLHLIDMQDPLETLLVRE